MYKLHICGRAPLAALLLAGCAVPLFAAEKVTFDKGFSAVAKNALPAVVSVSSTKIVTGKDHESQDPLFRRFFGGHPSRPHPHWEEGLASGVIIRADGYIITNSHAVSGAKEVKVTLSDRRQFTALVVGADPQTDIALLKVDARDLPMLPMGDSSKIAPGDFVLAIGNPFGLSHTVTMGIVSATGREDLDIEDYEDFIQTDAAINPGNSGGALINAEGQLIGINTAILTGGDGGGNEGIGFAIPINLAHQVMDQILHNGKVVRAYLGIFTQDVTPDLAKAFGYSGAGGALVGDVDPDSPASKAGFQKGDIIVAFDGKQVVEAPQLRLHLSMNKPGSTIRFEVFREGTKLEIPATLAEMPAKPEKTDIEPAPPAGALDGLKVDALTPDAARKLSLPSGTPGVVISDLSSISRAREAGLKRGDVIEQVNRQPVQNPADFARVASQTGANPALLLVARDGRTMFVVVKP